MKKFIFFCLSLYGYLCAQTPQFRNPELIIGKKDLKINQIYQDKHWNMWFATSKGLIQYNGINSTLYSTKDSLSEEICTALTADNQGNIWVGHEKGAISYQKNGKFFRLSPLEGLPGKKITSILVDKSGIVWFGTNGEGLYYWDGHRMNVFMIDEGLTDDHVYDLIETADGLIWAATDFGISIINIKKAKKERFSSLTMDNGLPDNLVVDFSYDKQKNLWIAMRDSGIVKYDFNTKKIQRIPLAQPWSYGSITAITVEANGNIWTGTDRNGVVILTLDKNTQTYTLQNYTTYHGIANQTLYALCTDHESNIWMGTSMGVTEYFGDQVQFLMPKDGLNAPDVYATFIDSQHNYWIGTAKGLNKLSRNILGKTEINSIPALKGLQVVAIAEDKMGYLWIGTYTRGFFRIQLKTGNVKNFTDKNGLPASDVIHIHIGKTSNTIYLATLGGGLVVAHIDEKNPNLIHFSTISKEQGLESQYIYSVFEDTQGQLWIGTDGSGLALYKAGKTTLFGEKEGLQATTVYSITEDINKQIWLSTPNGVFSFNGKTFTNIGLAEGLRTESPSFIYANTQHPELLIGHTGGIDKYIIPEKKVLYYSENEGLRNFDPHLNAWYWDKNQEKLWIGTTQGVVLFSTQTQVQSITPLPQITRFRIFLKDTLMVSSASFAHDQNHITFDFVGIYLKNPNAVKYKFKLEGHDRDWSMETNITTFTYSNLSPGTYTFQVLAANENGEWSKEPAVYTFTIRPPWYLTWTALVSFVFIIGGSLYGIYRRRLHQVEQQKQILEEEVAKRTKEVVEQKQIIEIKNQEITDSITYARRIQRAILPSNDILKDEVEHFVFYKPKDIVSGDFYWFDKVDEFVYIAVCDCTGHGVPGALLSMIGQNQLNLIVNESKILAPNEILAELDRRIRNLLHQDKKGSEAKDGMDAALCRICTKTGEVIFAGAMRPIYLVQKGVFEEVKSNKFPIGGTQQENKVFTPYSYTLQPGDSFYLFSDGYVDQFGGEKGRKFTPKRLRELIQTQQSHSIDEQHKIFESAWETWAKDYEQIDDVVIIGVQMI